MTPRQREEIDALKESMKRIHLSKYAANNLTHVRTDLYFLYEIVEDLMYIIQNEEDDQTRV